MSEGRNEYAAQFFQHLIDHYSETPEAAAARDAMARLYPGGPIGTGQPPANAVNGQAADHGAAAAERQPSQVNASAISGYPGGQYPNGTQASHPQGAPPRPYDQHELRADPRFGQQAPPPHGGHPSDPMPRHMSRAPGQAPEAAAPAQRMFVPTPEKNYIIGRVIAGLVLLVGIAGMVFGVGLIYAAFADPSLFKVIGLTGDGDALFFSGAVFLGSLIALLVAQMSTAVFDGADAASDIARLERYRTGDIGDDDS